jgi:hypothetical protein
MATTEQFTEHASVADGASNLFVQSLARNPVTSGWSMVRKACPLAQRSSLTSFLKSSDNSKELSAIKLVEEFREIGHRRNSYFDETSL